MYSPVVKTSNGCNTRNADSWLQAQLFKSGLAIPARALPLDHYPHQPFEIGVVSHQLHQQLHHPRQQGHMGCCAEDCAAELCSIELLSPAQKLAWASTSLEGQPVCRNTRQTESAVDDCFTDLLFIAIFGLQMRRVAARQVARYGKVK